MPPSRFFVSRTRTTPGSTHASWNARSAKLRLLGEYRNDRAALLIHLATLRAEAAVHLAGLGSVTPPATLDDRFLGWASPR